MRTILQGGSVESFPFARRNDGEMEVVFETAKGPLSAGLKLTGDMVREGITFSHVSKKLAGGIGDWEKLALIFENLRLNADPGGYKNILSETGDDGLVASWACEIASSMNLARRGLFNTTQFFYLYMDNKPELDALCERITLYYNQIIDIYAASDAEVVAWGGNFDETITYPPFFEEEIRPWLWKVAEAFHSAGKKMLSHADGENAGLMDLIKASGIDGAESVCPAPQTKLTLEKYLEAWGDSLAIIGGIPTDFLNTKQYSDDDFESYLKDLRRMLAGPAREYRYIPGIVDAVSPLADFDRLRRVGEVVLQ